MNIPLQVHKKIPYQQVIEAWQTGLTESQTEPWVATRLLHHDVSLFTQFAEQYQTLTALPRRARRSLQR